jgi:hypothetical protein
MHRITINLGYEGDCKKMTAAADVEKFKDSRHPLMTNRIKFQIQEIINIFS